MTRYRKTYAAAVAALTVTISLCWDLHVSAEEAIALLGAWSGVGTVWFFPNDPPAGETADPGQSERGQANWAAITAVCMLVTTVIFLLWAFGEVPR